MDWIRRNWPDLLIGLALLAVIAGIIATLLNGGSFFPFGQQASPPISSPAVPQASTQPGPTSSQAPTTQPSGAADPAQPGTPGDAAAGQPTGQVTGQTASGVTPVAPGQTASQGTDSAPAGAVTPVAPGGEAPVTTTTSVTATSPTTTTGTTSPGTATDLASSSDPFRIAVGSFGVAENAQRHAEAFRAQGYPVFTAQQGELTVVLVGPYASRSEAEAAQNAIRASGLESNPLLFQLDGSAADTQAATQTQATGSQATQTQATQTQAAPAQPTQPAPAGSSFVQVGAYNSPELAAPQRERLEQLGFSTSLRQSESSSLLRLWIGPFEGARLAEVRAQLVELGIEHFVPAQ